MRRRRLPASLSSRVIFMIVMALAALCMIAGPQIVAHARSSSNTPTALSTRDPRTFIPSLHAFPTGTRVTSHGYVTNEQAARNNGTPLALLKQYGREIGFLEDTWVPKVGVIEVEVVRFHSHSGMSAAYRYFLSLPAARGLPAPVKATGIGERAHVEVTPSAAFVEFMRGRYYVVVTSVPFSSGSMKLIADVSHWADVLLSKR